MIKKHKWTLLMSSVVILLPILAGLLLWNRLPEQIPTHWGPTGEADGWSSKGFAVIGLPAIVLPCGYDENGMPIGLQIIGKPFGEAAILNAAYALEKTITKMKPVL